MSESSRRVGIELELLAPSTETRATLARRVARVIGGQVLDRWHLDTEPSAHPDLDVFHHLTPAFDVVDADGNQYLRVVSDVTIHADLDLKAPSRSGWHRVLSDDPRFLRMVAGFLPAMGLAEADVHALADRFGLTAEQRGDTHRLFDGGGASVAMITTLPGEKHRVTECISPPMADGEGIDEWLATVVGAATELGFTVPAEGATHIHHDAEPFRQPEAFARLVDAFGHDLDLIRHRMRTNPRCRRLGPLPSALIEFVESDDYPTMTWDEVATTARTLPRLTKFADVNVVHLLAENPKQHTVEFRNLPATLDLDELRGLKAAVDTMVDLFLTTLGDRRREGPGRSAAA